MIYLQWILYDGNGRKTPKYNKTKYETKEKIGDPSIPSVCEMGSDCFPVFKNTENKPDLP